MYKDIEIKNFKSFKEVKLSCKRIINSIIQKTKTEDLAIHLVRMIDYQSVINPLKENAIERMLKLDSDIFLNLEKLLME